MLFPRKVSRLLADMGWEPTQIKRPNEEHVNALNRGNLVDGVERLLGLDLDHGQQRVVSLLKVLGEAGHGIESLH